MDHRVRMALLTARFGHHPRGNIPGHQALLLGSLESAMQDDVMLFQSRLVQR
jgi:hypothetical protein